jgi:hypothetical protein
MPRAAPIWPTGIVSGLVAGLALLLSSGCTELEPRASSSGGSPIASGGGIDAPGPPGEAIDEGDPVDEHDAARPGRDAGVPVPDGPPAQTACAELRAGARRVLEVNCAPCHQAPANQANFSFCLDVDRLASAVSSTGKKFLVPGAPEQSRLFERMANGEMPPAVVTQRPTPAEVAILRDWIAGCVMLGSGGFGSLDAGAAPDADPGPDPGPGCGKPRQPCCPANSCEAGGCCVLGYCRGNGQSCPGGPGGDALPGTCTNGSCVTAGIGCGGVDQACCGVVRSCTASAAVCPPGMSTCKPCGEAGGLCCRNGGLSTCREGFNCINNTYPNPGMCAPCGARGQTCCGDGPAARRHCNAGLTCRFEGGAAFVCEADVPAAADGGAAGQ